MEKTILIDNHEVRMKASALVPRLYRYRFNRDMISDMRQLQKAFRKAASLPKDATEEEVQDAQLSILDLTIFENVAYIMAKHADKTVADDLESWLDGFEMFSIYEVLPHILELWGLSQQTTSVAKKNSV